MKNQLSDFFGLTTADLLPVLVLPHQVLRTQLSLILKNSIQPSSKIKKYLKLHSNLSPSVNVFFFLAYLQSLNYFNKNYVLHFELNWQCIALIFFYRKKIFVLMSHLDILKCLVFVLCFAKKRPCLANNVSHD